ncbi:MAG: hypothetical protein ACI84R_002369, partial [Candidatus Azotimanducaceae bacterium]
TAEDKMYLMIKAWEICGQIGRPSKRVKCQLVGFRDAQLWSARGGDSSKTIIVSLSNRY